MKKPESETHRADTKNGRMKKEAVRIAISLVSMLALTLIVAIFDIPNPNMILITGLVMFTSLFGFPSGIVCTLDMIVYSMYFFSTDHSFFEYTAMNLEKIGVIILGTVICLLFIGTLKREQTAAQAELQRTNYLLGKTNELLKSANESDPLTGVRNRQSMTKEGSRLVGDDLYVVIFDIDDYSSLCDTYGNQLGEAVVKRFADAITSAFGDRYCYRFGGDQFAVIIKDCDEEKLREGAKAVKNRMAETKIDELTLRCTYSAGYVYGTADQRDDFDLMIKQADGMRSRAKKEGKDRIAGEKYLRSVALTLHDRPHTRW